MSDEELEKRVGFIIEQRAQFAAQIGQLEDILTRFAQATLARFEATDKRFDDVDVRISALVDAQMRTEENMRNLMAVVDRYFSEGRGRGSQE